jgi:AraC family transcriptional regulator
MEREQLTGNAREYAARVHSVMDYIDNHLADPLTLEELSRVAGFSKYHFHRIFASQTGETLFGFIQRLRLEKAALLLASDPGVSVTEAALEAGFGGSSSFARGFRQRFGVTPTEWRSKAAEGNSNFGIPDRNGSKADRNPGKSSAASKVYIEYAGHTQTWRYEMEQKTTTVTVKEISAWTLAYVRYVGPYAGNGELFQQLNDKLFKWAGARGLIRFPETQHLIMYHDSPEITQEDKLRVSVCITVPEDTQVDGDIGKMTLAAGKYAFARFRLGVQEFSEAWAWVYGTWLPDSGFAPDDGPCFEMYPEPGPDAEGRFAVDICVPVKPL